MRALVSIHAFLPARYSKLELHIVDYLTYGFLLALSLLLALYRGTQEHWPLFSVLNVGAVFLGLELNRKSQQHPHSSAWFVARILSLGWVILVGFIEIAQIQLIFVGDYWLSDFLVAADMWLFGVHPSVALESLHRPWLTELMSFFHISYYFMPLLLLIPAIRDGRRAELLDCAAVAIFSHCVQYTLYLFFAAKNPQHLPGLAELHQVEPSRGYVFAMLESAVQGEKGTTPGNCFPSAHASGAVVWALLAYRMGKYWGVLGTFLAAGTSVATVYLGFHHGVDPLAGVVLALLCYRVGWWLCRAVVVSSDPVTK